MYGAFLLACYDADSETFQTICKIGTGFSEEGLKTHADQLKELEVEKCRADVDAGGAKPDVWFEPRMVWEVLAADLSLSPVYSAAKGLVRRLLSYILCLRAGLLCFQVEERGISLRFPRFIRIRDDKDPDDATGPEQVCSIIWYKLSLAHPQSLQIAEMYERQSLATSKGGKKGGVADDFW